MKYDARAKKKKMFEKKIQYALILTLKYKFKRKNGFYLKFDENSSILINKNKQLLGSKVLSPVTKEMFWICKKHKNLKPIIKKAPLII